MEKENTTDANKEKTIGETDVTCCDFFKDNIKQYGWFKLNHLGEDKYLMPHILGTNTRLNFCPTCGKECRGVVLSSDLYLASNALD